MEFSAGQIIMANIAILVADAIKYWPVITAIFLAAVIMYLRNKWQVSKNEKRIR